LSSSLLGEWFTYQSGGSTLPTVAGAGAGSKLDTTA
jgi:hypothetical protein